MGSATLAAAAALAMTTGHGAVAQQARPTAGRTLDLAGLTIGMPRAEAERTLKARGYEIFPTAGDGWAGAVERVVANMNGNQFPRIRDQSGVRRIDGRNGGEKVIVELLASPTGGEVSSVAYSVPLAGRTPEQLARELQAKYGRPTTGGRSSARWCASSADCSGPTHQQHRLEANLVGGEMMVGLHPGQAQRARWKARLDAAARARGGAPKSTF